MRDRKSREPCSSGKWLMLLALCTAVTLAGVPADAQQKPNIILILSDDFGLRRLRPLRRRAGPRHAHAQPGAPGGRRDDLLLVLCPAELHAGPGGGADGAHPQPQRHDHRGLPGPGRRAAGGGVDAGLGAEDRPATRPSSRASGTWARRIMRCPPPRATTRCSMSASITSTPTRTPTRPGSPTWTRSCAPCSRR